jgi:hypothetical protein
MNQKPESKVVELAIADAVSKMTWQYRKYMRIESLIVKLSLIVWSGTFGDSEQKAWILKALKEVAEQPMDFFVEELVTNADYFAKTAGDSQFSIQMRSNPLEYLQTGVHYSGTLILSANSSPVDAMDFAFDTHV